MTALFSVAPPHLRAAFAGLLILAVVPNAACAQAADSDVTALLMKDVTTLASPRFAGRRSGTEGSRAAQAYITQRFAQIGLKPFGASYAMRFALAAKTNSGKTDTTQAVPYKDGVNLIGHIVGTVRPQRYIVVSAHYDHLGMQGKDIYAGADDNASGVAAMLAVAAHFKQHPPRNSIVFAAFDGEELGKQGADSFVHKGPVPIGQLALNLNFDMVSRSDSNEIYAAGARYTPGLRALVAEAVAGSKVTVRQGHDNRALEKVAEDDWTTQSDHASFHQARIPFVYFGVEDHPDYHKPSDTADKIDPVFFGNVTRMLIRAAVLMDQKLDTIVK